MHRFNTQGVKKTKMREARRGQEPEKKGPLRGVIF
jgi:hypothetical protein